MIIKKVKQYCSFEKWLLFVLRIVMKPTNVRFKASAVSQLRLSLFWDVIQHMLAVVY